MCYDTFMKLKIVKDSNPIMKKKSLPVELPLSQEDKKTLDDMLEYLKLSQDEYNKLFKKEEKLLEYKASLDRIYREKAHILTENEEMIISSLVNSMNHYDDISSTLLNTLHDYGTVVIDNEKLQLQQIIMDI